MRHRRYYCWAIVFLCGLGGRLAFADAFDPPPTYYNAATGTGATLKSQLHTIIKTGAVTLSYDSARQNLQITDADPAQPGHMLTVYDRQSLDLSTFGPASTGIPGWDNGVTWNREHTWPQSRGVGSERAG